MRYKECCEKCFASRTLADYIRKNGAKATCGFCGSEDVYCIDPESLQELFGPVIQLYSTLEDFMPLEDWKSGEYTDSIYDKLNYDWSLFPPYGDQVDQYSVEESLLKAIFPEDLRDGLQYSFLHSPVERQDDYWGDANRSGVVLVEMWEQFCREIRDNNRFFPEKTVDLAAVRMLLRYVEETLQKGTVLYRARISHDGRKHPPSEMAKPLRQSSEAGRANPKGIPYLYVSSSARTAISEVRPFIKDRVTVGPFKSKHGLEVVDLRSSTIGDPFRYGDHLRIVVDYLLFLRKLGEALSTAIAPRESDIAYVPTQYLSEFIKRSGYDGILYGSAMIRDEHEYNLVIFTDEKVRCTSTALYEVAEISHVVNLL